MPGDSFTSARHVPKLVLPPSEKLISADRSSARVRPGRVGASPSRGAAPRALRKRLRVHMLPSKIGLSAPSNAALRECFIVCDIERHSRRR
jgi:hypothetical protein